MLSLAFWGDTGRESAGGSLDITADNLGPCDLILLFGEMGWGLAFLRLVTFLTAICAFFGTSITKDKGSGARAGLQMGPPEWGTGLLGRHPGGLSPSGRLKKGLEDP